MNPYPFSFENHFTVPSAKPSSLQTSDGSGTEPPTDDETGRSLAQFFVDATAPARRNLPALTAFWSTIAIVIGPTPPGTGVMKAASSIAPGSTSPSTLRLDKPPFSPTS